MKGGDGSRAEETDVGEKKGKKGKKKIRPEREKEEWIRRMDFLSLPLPQCLSTVLKKTEG